MAPSTRNPHLVENEGGLAGGRGRVSRTGRAAQGVAQNAGRPDAASRAWPDDARRAWPGAVRGAWRRAAQGVGNATSPMPAINCPHRHKRQHKQQLAVVFPRQSRVLDMRTTTLTMGRSEGFAATKGRLAWRI
ncbi:MAG TPA: hypothetical protein DCP91_08525 [Eggerthellaceae bacterium]|nr:hypothetical protein [Eggerthellaceae bacterium]